MDWFKFCSENFQSGNYDNDSLKVFVAKKKITKKQYKEITNIEYVA